jgi:hypothetical protein
MNTMRLRRFSVGPHGCTSPWLLQVICSSMCTPWNTYLAGRKQQQQVVAWPHQCGWGDGADQHLHRVRCLRHGALLRRLHGGAHCARHCTSAHWSPGMHRAYNSCIGWQALDCK